ncbi:hypothetical protein JH06_4314 [Blastocystis sp. subtype 4]|uniref:hypothetical protein n=1 Tax=Blastocystis sp. subtype 4 TaxID=944170 RepID=UPI0007118470|nr:hypothetical protein JH06_4314 [Blastocystis sp. subtype 4]KNB43252.1 hypothetical protein JH06_4314 [Blastocystis sp. subtype 4]|eukprot:XP_014526702.1 hypothetical protein JH06_4314 [Blastocystis sp. subtype 4]
MQDTTGESAQSAVKEQDTRGESSPDPIQPLSPDLARERLVYEKSAPNRLRYRSLSLGSPPSFFTPPDSPQRPSQKNPYSPILTTHQNQLRVSSLFSPYKRPQSRSAMSSPRIKATETVADPFAVVYNEYMMVEPRSSRRRALSFGGVGKKLFRENNLPPYPNSHLISFPQLTPPLRRARSSDTLSPKLLRHPSINHVQSLHLTLVFNTVSKSILFSGTSLEDLKNVINSNFLYLPVVKVCIEHPSIPDQLVRITDIDQLYDNATIHLIPASL